jgi:hypothetical protein
MDTNKISWITNDGFFDPAKFPIDDILKQAVGNNERHFRSALIMLQSMCDHGRKEAGVFLLGMLVTWEDNWEQRIAIVDALNVVETEACVDLLFRELKRVKSSNTTRKYLTAILKVLMKMPSELVLPGFRSLCNDNFFTPRMRHKFKAILEQGMVDDEPW